MNSRYLAWIALVLIFIGWFLLDAVTTSVGSASLDFHFYEVAALIARPLRLLTGLGDGATLVTIPFALLCLALLVAPLVPALGAGALAPAVRFAPLALMLGCGAILYHETRQDTFTAARDASGLTNSLVGLANSLTHSAAQLVGRHINVGFGSWLAGAGALLLAYAGAGKPGHAASAAQ
jgi:hypothetical protein